MAGCQLPRGELVLAAGRSPRPHGQLHPELVLGQPGLRLAKVLLAPNLAGPQLCFMVRNEEECVLDTPQQHGQPQGHGQPGVGHHEQGVLQQGRQDGGGHWRLCLRPNALILNIE